MPELHTYGITGISGSTFLVWGMEWEYCRVLQISLLSSWIALSGLPFSLGIR